MWGIQSDHSRICCRMFKFLKPMAKCAILTKQRAKKLPQVKQKSGDAYEIPDERLSSIFLKPEKIYKHLKQILSTKEKKKEKISENP